MKIDELVRNPDKVKLGIKQVGDRLIAVSTVRYYIPEPYVKSPLASVGADTRIIGVHGIVVDGYYAASVALAMIPITPSSTNIVVIDDESYMEFTFQPGDIIVPNTNLVKFSTLVYQAFDTFVALGKIPWYLSKDNVATLFDTSKLHASANLGVNTAVIETAMSVLARQNNDRTKYYRHNAEKDSEEPSYIPMNSVAYQATNTTAKLSGAYFSDGLSSALVIESKTKENIEDLLRA